MHDLQVTEHRDGEVSGRPRNRGTGCAGGAGLQRQGRRPQADPCPHPLARDASHGEAHTDEDIIAALGTSPKTVARVRKRFVTEGIEAAIDHRPQPARPDKIKITGDVEQKLIELACTDPPRGRGHWTLRLLADEMVVLGLADSVSPETVRQA